MSRLSPSLPLKLACVYPRSFLSQLARAVVLSVSCGGIRGWTFGVKPEAVEALQAAIWEFVWLIRRRAFVFRSIVMHKLGAGHAVRATMLQLMELTGSVPFRPHVWFIPWRMTITWCNHALACLSGASPCLVCGRQCVPVCVCLWAWMLRCRFPRFARR